jgi:hypothetical protein
MLHPAYGAIRTALITYGTAAFTFLLTRQGPTDGSSDRAQGLLIAGVCLQIAIIAARALLRRRVSDPDVLRQALLILEIAADGLTVLLFALATLGAIGHATGEI